MEIKEILTNNKGPVGIAAALAVGVLAWLAFGFFGIQAALLDDVVNESGPVFDAAPAAVAEVDIENDVAGDAEVGAAVADVGGDAGPDANAAAAIEEVAADEAGDVAADEDGETEVSAEAQNQPGEIMTVASGSFSSLGGYSITGDALVLNNGTEQRFLRFENFESDNGPDLKVYLRADNGEFVSLGDLAGNIGDQNYEIPADVDLDVFNRVQIWCERFSVGFGELTLAAA